MDGSKTIRKLGKACNFVDAAFSSSIMADHTRRTGPLGLRAWRRFTRILDEMRLGVS